MVAESPNGHLGRLMLSRPVPLERCGDLVAQSWVGPDGERRRAREDDVRERIVLDRLEAEDTVVAQCERRGAEEAEKVDDEDAKLVLVLAERAGVVEDGDRLFDVGSVI